MIDWLAVAVPLASVMAAIAFWFGWRYSDTRGKYLGVETSVLGFTPTDYVLRSADALIIPAAFTSLVILIWLAAHGLLLHLIRRGRWTAGITVGAWGAATAGFALAIASVIWMYVGYPFDSKECYLLPPLLLGISAGLIAEASSLLRNVRSAPPPQLDRWQRGGYVMVGSLIVISLFWGFSEWAEAVGLGRATDLEQAQEVLTDVTVFSEHPLGLAGQVVETFDPEPGSAYPYKYTGLRFLIYADDKYFLMPYGWTNETGAMIVLPATSGIRLEYTPGEGSE